MEDASPSMSASICTETLVLICVALDLTRMPIPLHDLDLRRWHPQDLGRRLLSNTKAACSLAPFSPITPCSLYVHSLVPKWVPISSLR